MHSMGSWPNRQTLSTIQGLAQRLISRAKISTPKYLLNILLDLKPIELKIQETVLTRALSMKAEGHWDNNQYDTILPVTNREKIEVHFKELKISVNSNLDKIRPIDNITTNFNTKILERNKIQINKEKQNINVFTDGSKDETEKSGYGIYIVDNDIKTTLSEPMHNFNTVFQAEVTAIYKAAKIINQIYQLDHQSLSLNNKC